MLDADPVEREVLKDWLNDIRPADLAEYIASLDDDSTLALLKLLSPEAVAAVLAEADENTRRAVAGQLLPKELAEVIEEMEPDDGVDFLEVIADANEAKAGEVLTSLGPAARHDIDPLRGFADDSAGGIMTNQYIRVAVTATVDDVLGTIRRDAEIAEDISVVYVVDDSGVLHGVLSLRNLLVNPPDRPIREFMVAGDSVITVSPDLDQEDVYAVLSKYDLPMVPVVDAAGKLLGVVTFDDVLDVAEEEADEDLRLMAGMNEHDPVHGKIWRRVFSRLPWLMITLGGTFITATVLAAYEHTLATITATMFFVPAVTAMSGNVGLQSSTTFVRALALGTIQFSMLFTLIGREVVTGAIIGTICGTIVGTASLIFGGDGSLGLVVCMAMIVAITISSIVGTITPLVLDRFGMDPALGAGPFITTVNDIIALGVYMTIATALLIWFPIGGPPAT